MKTVYHLLQIRATHRYAFRSGEWASLLGVVIMHPDGKEPRICYHVAFKDGVVDYWPTQDVDCAYDIRSSELGAAA